jgi:hypothetical protein
MMALVSLIVLVAVLAGPAGAQPAPVSQNGDNAQSVYQNTDGPAYPVFEVNAQTAHPATTWSERATQWIANLATKLGVSTSGAEQGTPVTIGF